MDAKKISSGSHRLKLAVALGALALAVPGGAAIGSAFAADSAAGSGSSVTREDPADNGFAPVQDEQQQQPEDRGRPDGRDCPKDGQDGGSGGAGESGATGESGGAGESGGSGTAL